MGAGPALLCPFLSLCWALASAAAEPPLQRGMPNVCPVFELALVGHQEPCVQAFSQMVKMWKQGCTKRRWCVSYERRSGYYTVYKQVYRMEHQTVYKCCPGWAQRDNEPGCLHLLCTAGTCFNGGKCSEEGSQVCQCPAGFQGPRCQYGCISCLSILSATWILDPVIQTNLQTDTRLPRKSWDEPRSFHPGAVSCAAALILSI